ncbi:hypothetical protein QTP70_022804 [Hemibagrus guttatus]|uniref:ribonuclease H n=1 Tax=Hemibagrus guttatus TaxID=175788 RepID=A0AAE0R2C0_9TELE|nr:hypothetical protein QTP70_022804 [Hemibagrus guttatus]
MDQLSEEVRQESPWTMMFADDIVICSESREQVEENLERWRFALERRGMKVSRSKTEYMCVNEREGSGTVRLQGEEVKKVQEFKYLGSTVQSNGECGKEVKKRVQAGWNGWRKVWGVLCDQKISARIKGKVYRTVVRAAMLYGLETVSLRKRQESELEVAELKMLRFSLGVTRLDRIRNEYIRGTAHVGRLGDKVREARLRWFGHVQRRESEYIGRRMLDMELPGRRQRGRPKRRYMDGINEDMKLVGASVEDAEDRDRWREMIRSAFPVTRAADVSMRTLLEISEESQESPRIPRGMWQSVVFQSQLFWKQPLRLTSGFSTAPPFYSPTVLQPHSPTVLQPHSSTAPPFYSPIVPQFYSPTVLQPHSSTAPQFYSPIVPQFYSPTVLQPHSPTVLQPHSSTAPPFYSPIVPQFYSPTVLQPHSSTAPQFYSPTVLQPHRSTAPQFYSPIVPQFYSPTVLQSHSPTVLQPHSSTPPPFYSPIVPQFYSPTVLQPHSSTAPQFYSPTVLQPHILARLVSDLQAFLLVLDGENLSYIAQAKKKSISELLSKLQENRDTAVVEDAEYMIMNCPSGGPANDLRRNSATDPVSTGNPHFEWLRCPSVAPVVPSQPPYRLEEDEDCYEEAEPFIPASQSTDKLDSESSHYESYGEEDDDAPVDRAHYIQCGSSQPCLRPVPESLLCEYLWRKKWLGQWTRQLFIIKQDSLLCFKCAKDLQPLLEMKLAGCQVVYKSKHSKKMQHELKVVGGSDTLILGFQSCSQAEEWRKTIEELSGSSYCEPESTCSSSILKSERLDSCRSSSVLHTDSDEEILRAPSSALSSTDNSSYKDRAGYLNVLMNYQWQTLWCRVDAGVLNLFSDESSEVTPQYTVQLRGSEIRPDTHTHTHRITIKQHGDQVAVLEASCPDDKEHWVQLLRDGSSADVVSPNQRNSHESLSGLKTRTLPNANTYMDDPFQQLCGSVRGSPIYCNTASLERMLHKSHTGGNVESSDSAEYSNCDIFRSNSKKVCEVERGVQKLQLTGKRVQVRAGSEVNLVNLGTKPAKRSSFRQSLLPFCSDRAQGGFLTPLLRRTASAKLSLRRSPSTLLIEHGHVFHRRKGSKHRV